MTPEFLIDLMAKLQADLERAANGLPILMQRERAVATLDALQVADRRALLWTGGAA